MEDSTTKDKYRLLTIQTNEDVDLLRKKSDPVSFVIADNSGKSLLNSDDAELIAELKKFVVENNGLGMSAVQLGVHRSIFVMRKPWNSDRIITVINPRLRRGMKKNKKPEACFSFPNLDQIGAYPLVERHSQIWVDYEDEDGTAYKDEFMIGVDARIFQHELMHTQGILMTDGNHFKGWVPH